MQQVEITIAADGSPTIKVNGVKGLACKDVTKTVGRALGKVVSDKPTAEAMSVEVRHNVQH